MASFGYQARRSFMHRLTGATKLILVLSFSISAMITFDTRFLVLAILSSGVLFSLAKIKISELKVILGLILVFIVINNLAIYLFAPEQGVLIYGTRHELLHIAGRYAVTKEQLFYQLNVSMKYFAIVPVALVFFISTEPGEFASSLNTLKVNYKAAYAVSLSMRYIPDVQRAYREISQAQQARGVDISKKAPIRKRLSGVLMILFPLVFSRMDKIELIANAMELRGFGRLKKRSWYAKKPFTKFDYGMFGLSLLFIALSAATLAVNGGRFYNPFGWK